jgi:gluconate 2-dehydrogenase gamma chain
MAKKYKDEKPVNPSRRDLLKSAGLVGAAVVSTGTTSNVIAADSSTVDQSNLIAAREALEVLTAEEADTLEAVCDCLIPSDANGPGAKEARAVHYIDRSLASHNSSSRYNYTIGVSALNDYCRATKNKAFYELIKDQQNSVLLALQSNKIPGFSPSGSGFFNLVRRHTIDGTFSDPYYGGNKNFVGWDMLSYPGVRLGASESDVAKGATLEPNHRSVYEIDTYTKSGANNAEGGGHA